MEQFEDHPSTARTVARWLTALAVVGFGAALVALLFLAVDLSHKNNDLLVLIKDDQAARAARTNAVIADAVGRFRRELERELAEHDAEMKDQLARLRVIVRQDSNGETVVRVIPASTPTPTPPPKCERLPNGRCKPGG